MTPEKLLESRRRSKGGWSADDLERVYTAYGFTKKKKTKHDVYTHPLIPGKQGTVGRHKELADGYAASAVKLIDEVLRLQGEEDAGNDQGH